MCTREARSSGPRCPWMGPQWRRSQRAEITYEKGGFMATKVTSREKLQIRYLRDEGYSIMTIVSITGRSKTTIRKVLKK